MSHHHRQHLQIFIGFFYQTCCLGWCGSCCGGWRGWRCRGRPGTCVMILDLEWNSLKCNFGLIFLRELTSLWLHHIQLTLNDKVSYEFITRPILTVNSPKSPGMDLTLSQIHVWKILRPNPTPIMAIPVVGPEVEVDVLAVHCSKEGASLGPPT